MRRIQIRIDLQDKEYARRLAEFLNSHYSERVQAGLEGTDELPDEGLLVTDRHRADAPYTRTVLLGEKGINPFQSIHSIMDQIFVRQGESMVREAAREFGVKKGSWLSVCGYSGGSGTSALALCLAHALKTQGSVLFLPLEGSGNIDFFENTTRYTVADLLYCFVFDFNREWEKDLKNMVSPQGEGLFYLAGASSVDDLQELDTHETEEFVRRLRESFDYVVADLGTAVCQAQRTIVEKSDVECRLLNMYNKIDQRKKEQAVKLKNDNRRLLTFVRGELPGKSGTYVPLPEDDRVYLFDGWRVQLNLESQYMRVVQGAVKEFEWMRN